VSNNREYPERPVVGVGGVVIFEGRVLLVRRAAPPLEGEWSIPGGMLETGETVFEGLRRELAEEPGVDARVVDLIEVFERISLDAEGKTQYHYVVLDYFCERIRGDGCAGSDAADVAWATEKNLSEYALSASACRVIQKAFDLARDRAVGPKKRD
jgi:8-oxo-dGTP diphosphatase